MNGIVTGKQEKKAGSLVWKGLWEHTFTADDYVFSVEIAHIQNAAYEDLYLQGLLYIKFISSRQSPFNVPPIYMPVFSMGIASGDVAKIFVNREANRYITTYIDNFNLGSLFVKPADRDNPVIYYLNKIEIGTFE